MPFNAYWATTRLGGGTGAGDKIPGANLADKDMLALLESTDTARFYWLDADASGSEGETVINPDTDPGTKSWLLLGLTVPNTGLHILDSNATHDLIIKPGSDLTADREFTITTGDAARTLTLNENFTIGDGTDITITGVTAARTLTLNENLTVGDGTDITLTGVTQANTLTLYESLTLGDGNSGTLTYSAASKTLTVEDNAIVSQDYTSDSTTVTLGKLTLTSAQAQLLDLNPGATGTAQVIDITPSQAIATQDAEWDGVKVDGQNLDPSAIGVMLCCFHGDLSGVNLTNSPLVHSIHLEVPATAATGLCLDILHLDEGCIFHRVTAGSVTAAEYRAYDLAIDVSNLDQYAHYHALDIEITGTLTGEVAALATGTGISPVHQHLETWTAHNQTTGAFRYVSSFTAGVDGNECWVANGNYIILGHTSKWDAFEVIMTSKATKSVVPTFWYMNGSSAWVQFYPIDGTDGFQYDGKIEWDSDGFTDWDSAQDPTSNSGLSGYWIKIVRTRNADPGTPTPTNIKYLSALTEYEWDELGALSIKNLVMSDVVNAATETDKFLVLDASNNVDYRTAAELITEISAQPLDPELTAIASTTSARDKLPYFTGFGTGDDCDFTSTGRAMVGAANAAAQLALLSANAIAAFDWNNQNLTNIGTIGCGTITVVDGSSINLQEDVTFTGATTENLIKFPDTLADALSFKEGANAYMTFVTTDGSEAVNFGKTITVSDAGNIGSVSDPDAIAISSGGDVTFTQDIIMSNGKTIGQAAGPLLTFNDTNNILTITGGLTRIGDGGTASYATGDGDLYVEDNLEVDGNVTLLQGFTTWGGSNFRAAATFHDNIYLGFGSSLDTLMLHEPNAVNQYFNIRTNVGSVNSSGNIIISSDFNVDWGQPLVADVHLRIQSSDQTSTSDFIQFWHDQTDANIEGGAGDLNITSAASVDIVNHDLATVGLKLSGTLVTASAAELNALDGITADGTSLIQAADYAAMLALLTGQAGAAFSWNSQNLTSVGPIGCGAITTTALFTGTRVLAQDLTMSGFDDYYRGIENLHTKTSGATGEEDDMFGIYNDVQMNDGDSTIGHLTGIWNRAYLVDGTLGDGQEDLGGVYGAVRVDGGTVSRNVRGLQFNCDINGGTIGNDINGIYTSIDIEPEVTSIGGDVFGAYIKIDADKDPVGSVYMIYLDDLTNVDYCIYQSGTAPSHFGGDVDINVHDAATVGLKLGGTLVTASAAEINLLDGASYGANDSGGVGFRAVKVPNL